ncbi:MAG TPA: hypothetical protein VME46_22540 [Acidimicrobiales bacterium]|nr:hypothetical protein [Acidimicrobiales bacterium]
MTAHVALILVASVAYLGSRQEGVQGMDRLRLKRCLEAAGVPADRYLLVGVDAPKSLSEGACVVRPNQRNWEVLVREPVHTHPTLVFVTEAEACEYVLDALTTAAATTVRARPGRPAEIAGAGATQPV